MTQEKKQLLLIDLCARLPYGVRYKGDGGWGVNLYQHTTSLYTILNSEEPLVYLRPMSSMTDEEKEEWNSYVSVPYGKSLRRTPYCIKYMDWLLEHHFDFRHLIEKGLALEAPEEMYKTESL